MSRWLGVALSVLTGCGSAASYELSGQESQALYERCVASVPKPAEQAAAPSVDFELELAPTNPSEIDETLRRRDRNVMLTAVDNARYHAVVRARCESFRPRTNGGEGSSGGGSSGGGSGTNNQVAGVDEADFIKSDEGFIYITRGDRLRIIDVRLPSGAYEIASVEVPGEARRLFVTGDRLVVYSAVGAGGAPLPDSMRGRETTCTYAYSCSFSGDGTETVMSVFDIADRRAPRLVRKLHATGSFLAARRVDDMIHTVLAQQPLSTRAGWETFPKSLPAGAAGYSPGYWSWPSPNPELTPIPTEAEVNAAFDDLLRENEKAIGSFAYASHLPHIIDTARGDGLRRDRNSDLPHVFFKSRDPDGESFTTFLSFDLVTDKPANAVTIISKPGAVYASKQAIYMAVAHNRWGSGGWYGGRIEPQVSTVHQLAIGATPTDTAYRASGLVPGHVLGQFAMDEQDGLLRIATTTGHAPDPKTRSTLTVLERHAKSLLPIGALDNIAPSEDIRSVRFDGTRAYVVTFKKTDPLFVFDLASPTSPRMLGELKIPGFSTYMHMMDDAHLLTIGYDAADKGSFAFFTGVLLQIFDVSNATAPTLRHRHVIGTRGSSSEALTNHLAFTYFAPKKMLALPMTICEGGNDNGSYGSEMTFSGLMVFDVSVAGGFSLRGKVAHPTGANTTCDNWWTDANSEVRRSIFKDDVVFSVSNKRLKANVLTALEGNGRELGLE